MARDDYWKMFAWRAGIVLVAFALAAGGGGEMGEGPGVIGLLAALLALVVGLSGIAEACRRLHDTGKPGMWNFLLLIPYIGWAGLIYLLAQPGEPGANPYGPPPGGAPGR